MTPEEINQTPANEPAITQTQSVPAPEIAPEKPVIDAAAATPQTTTSQIPDLLDPLTNEPSPASPAPLIIDQSAPISNETSSVPSMINQPAPAVAAPSINEKFTANMGKWKEHLALAMAKRRQKWEKNLDKILQLAQQQGTITNKQVKKALRCTKLTAWRYLRALEKQNKIKRTGGHNTPTYELVR